jgi:hypothetical protein
MIIPMSNKTMMFPARNQRETRAIQTMNVVLHPRRASLVFDVISLFA